MTRRLLFRLTALCLVVAAPSAFAQDEDRTRNYAEMFLWSDDVIGLIIIWVLLLLSATSIGYAIKLTLEYRRSTMLPDETRDELETLLSSKKYREAIDFANADDSYLGKVTAAALNEAANGYSAMERAIEEAGDAETTRVLRPIEYLNVLGNIAPMMGLFGTVYGMILAFQSLVAAGGQPDPVELAGGISTALVTTFWGLVVAIPALAAYALVRNKVDALTTEGLIVAEELISPFKPGAKKSSSGSSSTSASSSSSSSSSRPQPQPQA